MVGPKDSRIKLSFCLSSRGKIFKEVHLFDKKIVERTSLTA